jgi:hypothetical protein
VDEIRLTLRCRDGHIASATLNAAECPAPFDCALVSTGAADALLLSRPLPWRLPEFKRMNFQAKNCAET